MTIQHEHYDCECNSEDHSIRFTYWIDEDGIFDEEIYLSVQLPKQGLFHRLWNAIKYVFNVESTYGHWDTTIIKQSDAKQIRNLLDKYIKSMEK